MNLPGERAQLWEDPELFDDFKAEMFPDGIDFCNPDFLVLSENMAREGKVFDDETISFPTRQEALDAFFRALKRKRLREVHRWFVNKKNFNKFRSTTLSTVVDNRRDSDHNDLQNIDMLIRKGVEPVDFKDAQGEFITGVTLVQLESLRLEMIDNALGIYQQKWSWEEQIKAATTKQELNSIVIG